MRTCSLFLIAAVVGSVGLWPRDVLGDGGTLRAWKQDGTYDVAVFTEPTPFVSGTVDVSVLLLDRKSGEPITNAEVTVEVSRVDRSPEAGRHPATRQAATNKLLYAAVFTIRATGRYRFRVDVHGPNGVVEVPFDVEVGNRWTPGLGVWSWILWPLPITLLYTIHRRLVAKARKNIVYQSRRDASS